ncbi:MAG: hypothetical protein H7Y11_11205 [Armatimonadetes bacterium]|nr:hypothetical protein [Anaerolineae bacterium]
MTELTFEEVVAAAQKLSAQQKMHLVARLALPSFDFDVEPTREQLLADFDLGIASGAFNQVKSLRNQYARPELDDLTEEQLLADIHVAATEWEQKLDEFFPDHN